MVFWSVNILLFKEKFMFKSQLIKYKHKVLGKTYGAPVFHMNIVPALVSKLRAKHN